jgi:hypothetical protein
MSPGLIFQLIRYSRYSLVLVLVCYSVVHFWAKIKAVVVEVDLVSGYLGRLVYFKPHCWLCPQIKIATIYIKNANILHFWNGYVAIAGLVSLHFHIRDVRFRPDRRCVIPWHGSGGKLHVTLVLFDA